MNGAETLVKTFLANGVDMCFANPGTSEMHFVAALDAHPEMRCVLCLFEGGVSGAADAYFRMSGRPAATLLHLAPGFGNAYANLHNGAKAGSGIVNVMGDHATRHLPYESPLKGNTDGVAGAVSHWVRRSTDAADLARDGAAAIRAARSRNGRVATLILPADTAWEDGGAIEFADPPADLLRPGRAEIAAAVQALKQPGAALLVGGVGAYGAAQERAAQIARATGATLMVPLFTPRVRRGAGAPAMQALPYAVDALVDDLAEADPMVIVGSSPPVAFFAYPGKPSLPTAPGAHILELARPDMDVAWTLDAIAEALEIPSDAPLDRTELSLPPLPEGPLTLEATAAAIANAMPEDTVVCNEAVTAGTTLFPVMATARAHDAMGSVGGSIGFSLPASVGAAMACPDRPVLCLTGDGSAMYTIQSLWTMAREELNVTVVVFANRGYQILRGELANLGVQTVGRNAQAMFDVENPMLDFVALAKGHGVTAWRPETAEALTQALTRAFTERGPHLIEVPLHLAPS